MATNGRIPAVRYVYDIPYATRRRLCMVLDGGGAWKTLAGELGYSSEYIRYCELALQRPGGSPTDDILNEWGHRNPTVTSLFRYLRDMKHYRALSILKHLVPEEMYRGIELCEVAGEEKVVRQPLVINNVNRCEEQRHTSDLPAPPPHFPIQDQQNIPQSSKAGENGDEASNAISYTDNAAYSDYQEVSAMCETAKPGGHKSMKDAAQKRMPVESLDTSLPTKGKGDLTTFIMCPDKSAMPYNRNAQLGLKALSQSAALMNTQHFSHSEITQATYGFHDSNLLGNGGFGRVYKGILKKTLFAIKQLKNKPDENNTKVQQQQHMAEIEALLRYRHDNIIQLCGYSMDGPQLCLVYQYMENGSLENRLACKDGTKPLYWHLRHHILTGSARGIQYLHSLDEKPLIHGDIKSANILLDRHFDPKVADFGLAKQATSLGQSGQFTHVSRKDSEKVFGSIAYLPEEFFGTYQFSTKTDTYSFGVVIYETCTGEQAQDEKREGGRKLKDYIDKIWSLDNHDEFQQRLQDKKAPDWPTEPWAALMRLGQECTSPKKKQRPIMQNVLSLLEKIEGDSCTTPGSVASLSERFMHLSYRSEGQGQNNLAANLENGHDPDDDHKLVLESSNVLSNAADSESCTSNGKLSQIRKIPDSHANQTDNDPDDLPYDCHKLELDSTESTCNVTDRGRELDQKLDQTPGKPEGSPGEQGDDRNHMASSNDDLSTCDTDTSCTDVDKQSSLETRWPADTSVAVDGLSDTRSCSTIDSGKESIQIKGLMEDINKLGNDMSSPAKQEWAFDDAEISRKCSKKRPQFVLDFLSTGDESGDQCNGAASMMSDSCFTKGEQQDTATESTDLYGPAPLGDKIGAKSQ